MVVGHEMPTRTAVVIVAMTGPTMSSTDGPLVDTDTVAGDIDWP